MSPLDKYSYPKEWHENRVATLRGSDVKALVQGNPRDIRRLWKIKTGREVSPEKLSIPGLLGKVLEGLNRDLYMHETKRDVWDVGKSIVHPEHLWIGASLDGITTSADGREAYFEAKSIDSFKDIKRLYKLHKNEFYYLIAYRKWRETAVVPLLMQEYKAQCHVAMACGGWSVTVLSMLIGNRLFIREIEFDTWYWLELFALMEEFWFGHVLTGIKPGASVMRGLK